MKPEHMIIVLLFAIVLVPIIVYFSKRVAAKKVLDIPMPRRKEPASWMSAQSGAYIDFFLASLNEVQRLGVEIDYQKSIIAWLAEREKSYKILRKTEDAEATAGKRANHEELLNVFSKERLELIHVFSSIIPHAKNTLVSYKELKLFNRSDKEDIFNEVLANPKRIMFNNKEGIFCGNFILIIEGTKIRLEPYSGINLNESYLLENLGFSRSVSRDDEIAETHWLHEKKRGGPDKRYSYNPCSYVVYRGKVTISYDARTIGFLKFSNRIKAHSAYLELNNLIKKVSDPNARKIYSKMLKIGAFLNIEEISKIIKTEEEQRKNLAVQRECVSREKGETTENIQTSAARECEKKVVVDMDATKRQPAWDIYESVILLDACLKVKNGADRKELEKDVSEKLRKKAIFEGKTIDSIYRNTNGIHWQMDRMLSLLDGNVDSERSPSKCFIEAVNLYNSNKEAYYELLKKANKSIGEEVVEEEENLVVETIMPLTASEEIASIPERAVKVAEGELFFLDFNLTQDLTFTKPELVVYFGEIDTNISSWSGVYKSILKALHDDYPEVLEAFAGKETCTELSFDATKLQIPICISGKIYAEGNGNANDLIKTLKYLINECNVDYENIVVKYSILKTSEESTGAQPLQQACLTTHIAEQNVEHLSQFDKRLLEVIKERYLNGFLVGAINFKKIRRFYNEKFGEELTQSNDEIEESLRKSCLYVNGKYYAVGILMEDELKFQVVSFIQDGMLSNGYVFYENIIARFGYELTERIPDKELLKQFLQIILPQYVYLDVYMARDSMVSIDPTTEVERVLLEAVYPISVEKIKAQLPHLTDAAIQKVISSDENIITTNGNERFHIDSMGLTAEDLKNIERHISELLEIHNYMFGNELLDILRTKMSELYESIKDFGDRGIRGAIAKKLKGKFQFNANIICKIGLNLDNSEVFKAFALSERYFTLEALINLKEQIGVGNIYFDVVNEVASRINATDYVPNDALTFATEQVDAAIEQIMQNRRMCSLKEASDFTSYPNACYPWTEYLLESYTFKYSERYKLLHVGFAEGKCAGAIVDKSSKILDLDDVVVEYLKNNINIQTSSEALTCLVEDGYIARKRYKNIEDLLLLAKSKRKEN